MRRVFERVGLWHVYATRPDGRIEGFGDEGSRVDLKDETRRVIDLLAQLTGHPVLATYSRYLQKLRGRASYYRGYRWGFPLFNDPGAVPVLGIEPGELEGLSKWLPEAALFGPGAMNYAYIRSGWGEDDTFISFRAGGTFTHHGHYDAGHFTLFKASPLAINSSTYGGVRNAHRLNYAIRTVAKNSILILRKGEVVKPNRFFDENVADGGQRIVLPTGSGIRSVEDWRENLESGLHLEGGRVLQFENVEGEFAYIAADLTRAYNNPDYDVGGTGGKVSKLRRELLYLYAEDRLIIYDDIISVRSSYTKKWLLHTVGRPQVAGLRVLKGHADNGILESASKEAIVHNGRGYLHVKVLYPNDAVLRLVGGKDYRYYVETDGDDRVLDGRNYDEGARQKAWFDNGFWRIELQPGSERKEDRFLVVLTPSLDSPRNRPIVALEAKSDNARVVATEKSLVGFTRLRKDELLELDLSGGQKRLYLAGFPPGAKVTISFGRTMLTKQASGAGILAWEPGAGIGDTLSLSWH